MFIADAHGAPTQIHQVRVGSTLTGLHALVPLVHLLVSLAGPAPSGSADAPRRCQDCFPPSPASPGSGCPQLQPGCCDSPAARAFHPYSVTLAPRGARTGRRTGDQDHRSPIDATWSGSVVPVTRPVPGLATARRYSPAISHPSSSSVANSLPSFALWPAFPTSDYYGGSATSPAAEPTTRRPAGDLDSHQRGRPGMLPTFTAHRSTGSVANFAPAVSPRVRRRLSSWPPCRRLHPARESPAVGGRAPPSGPYPPGWSRCIS